MTAREARQFMELRTAWRAFLRATLEAREFAYARKCLAQTLSTEDRDKQATRGAEIADLITWVDTQISSAEKLIERQTE